MKRKMNKEDILTIPNFLSAFRLLLIPVLIALYGSGNMHTAAAVIVLSAVTDFTDGRIARKYNMVSTLGTVLDPLADKLTQGAMMLCLISRSRLMYGLIALLVVKELLQLYLGWNVFRRTGRAEGALWCGKLSTGIIYAVMISLFLFPGASRVWTELLLAVCAAALLTSMALYCRSFVRTLRDTDRPAGGQDA